MLDPENKEKLRAQLIELKKQGKSRAFLDEFARKFQEKFDVKKKEDTPIASDQSSQSSGDGSTPRPLGDMSVLEAQQQDLQGQSILEAQQQIEQEKSPGIGLKEYQQIALDDARTRTMRQIKADPQFVTQAKNLQKEAIELARSEVLNEVNNNALSEEAANEMFSKRASEIYQQRIAEDSKMQSLQGKFQQTLADEAQKNIDAYLKITQAKQKANRLPILSRIDNTVVGQAIAEMFETTLPREYASNELRGISNEISKLRKAQEYNNDPEKWDEQRKRIEQTRGRGIPSDEPTEDLKGVPEKEINDRIKERLGLSEDLLKKIDQFDLKMASSDLNRDLIEASDDGLGELANTIGALFGDQLARIPTMLVGGSFMSEMGNIYMDNVNKIAEKEGITPIEVIEQGKDEEGLAAASGMMSGSLDMLGLGKIVSLIKNAAKNTLKKNALGVLTGGAVEGITEGAQNVIAQQAGNIATGEEGFDMHELANEALAGATMGTIFALPGLAASSRSYKLNGQEITRDAAKELINAGDIDGLTINNDSALQERVDKLDQQEATVVEETPKEEVQQPILRNKEEVAKFVSDNLDVTTAEAENIATEVDESADRIVRSEGISKEQAIQRLNVPEQIQNDERLRRKQLDETQGVIEQPSRPVGDGQVDVEEQAAGEGRQEPQQQLQRLDDIRARRAQVLEDIRVKSQGKLRSGIDPELVGDYVRLARTYLDEGIVKVEEFISRFKEEIKNTFGSDMSDADVQTIYDQAVKEQAETAVQKQTITPTKGTKTIVEEQTGVKKEPQPKKTITINESRELARQLKEDVKTARDAKNWVINNQKAVIKFLKDNVSERTGGRRAIGADQIRINKAISLMNKIAEAPKTDKTFRRNIQQINDILARESIMDFRRESNKLRKSVSKRRNQLRGSENEVETLLNINPALIPPESQAKYLSTMRALAARGIPSGSLMTRLNEITQDLEQSALNNEENMNELAERVKYHQALQKKKNDDELIEAVMDDLSISDPGDRRVYRDFIKDFLPDLKRMARSQEGVQKIATKDAQEDMDEVLVLSKVINPSAFKDERIANMVNDFKNLKANDLKDFSRNEISNLRKVLDNLTYGYVSPRFRSFQNKIVARRNFEEMKKDVSTFEETPETVFIEDQIQANKKILSREKIFNKMRRAHLQNIEFMVGRVKNNAIYKKLINPLVRGQSAANQEADKNHKVLARMFESGLGGIDRKAARETNILMNMVMTERENRMNPENNKSHSVADHMEALAKSSVDIDTRKGYEGVFNKFKTKDGEFDLEKAVRQLRETKLKKPVTADGIEVQNADDITRYMRKILDTDIRGKAQFLKNQIEDEAFSSWPAYFPQRSIKGITDKYEDQIAVAQQSQGAAFKSGNLQERESKAGPIRFDAYGNFERAVRSINLQFNIQQQLNETQATLNLMQRKGDEQTQQMAGALQDIVNRTIEHDLSIVDTLGVKGFRVLKHVVNKIFRNETMQTLSSVFRVGSEAISNHFGLIKLNASGKFLQSSINNILQAKSNKAEMQGVSKIMTMYGSTQSNRLGRISDEREHRSSIDQTRIQQAKEDKLLNQYVRFIENNTLNGIASSIEGINKKLVSLGDSIMIKPVWWTSFKDSFERSANTQVTTEDMLNRDFRIKFNREIQDAVAVADKNTSLVVNTGSPAETSIQDKEWRRDSLWRFGTFLKGFSTNEAFIFRDAIASWRGKRGSMSRGQAVKVMLAQIAQQSMYSIVRFALLDQFFAMMGNIADWDEPEDKDAKDELLRIGVDLLFTNSIGHWNNFYKSGAIYAVDRLAREVEEFTDVEGVSDAIYEVDFNYGPSILRNFGGVAGVAWDDISKLSKNLWESPENLEAMFDDEISEEEINIIMPLFKLTTGIPVAKDLETLYKSQTKRKKSSRRNDVSGDIFYNPDGFLEDIYDDDYNQFGDDLIEDLFD